MASLFAATSYSLNVSAEAATPVRDGDDSVTQTVSSPDGTVEFTVDASNRATTYSASFEDTTIIDSSGLGFEFQNQANFGVGSEAVEITVTGSEWTEVNTTWEPVWDRYDEIREQYTELGLGLEESGDPG